MILLLKIFCFYFYFITNILNAVKLIRRVIFSLNNSWIMCILFGNNRIIDLSSSHFKHWNIFYFYFFIFSSWKSILFPEITDSKYLGFFNLVNTIEFIYIIRLKHIRSKNLICFSWNIKLIYFIEFCTFFLNINILISEFTVLINTRNVYLLIKSTVEIYVNICLIQILSSIGLVNRLLVTHWNKWTWNWFYFFISIYFIIIFINKSIFIQFWNIW